MADGSIEFSVELDAKNAEKELQKIKMNIMKLEAELRAQTSRKTALEEEMERAGAAADAANARLQELLRKRDELKNPTGAGDLSFEDFTLTKKELDAQIKEQEATVKGLEKDFNAAADAVDKMNAKIDKTTDELRAAQELGGEIVKQTAEQNATLDGSTELAALFGSRLGTVAAGIAHVLTTVTSGIVKAGRAVAAFGKRIADVLKRMNVFQKLTDTFGKKLSQFGTMLRRLFYFRVIYKGLTAIKEQLASYLAASSELMRSVGRLKGALLTMVQPIYVALLPVLAAATDALTKMAAAAARLTSALFGKTAKESQESAEALYNESKALDKAKKSADKAKRALAGFDEINKLTFGDDGDSGAGGEVSSEPRFDKTLFSGEETVQTLGEALNDMMDDIVLRQMPRLRVALGDFVDWLNDWARRLYDAFTMPGLAEKAAQLGRELADALNRTVAGINWYTLGAALGAGLNLALQFLVNFLYTFDWIALGKALAAFVNGAVSEIDWYAVGQLLWAGFKIAIETLAGFLLGLDMAQLAEAASNIVIGFFEAMTETIKKIDWSGIAEQIKTFLVNLDWAGVATALATEINTLVRSIDWARVAEIINAGVHGVFEFAKTFLATLDWEAIGHAIGEFLVNIDWLALFTDLMEIGAYLIAGLMKGMFSAAAEIDKKLIEWLNSLIQKVKDAVATITGTASGLSRGGSFGTSGGFGSSFQIPKLAEGAVIPPNSSFLAVLGDQRSGTNIETPLDTMVEAFKLAMAESGGSRSAPQTLVLKIGEREAGRIIFDLYNAQNANVGVKL